MAEDTRSGEVPPSVSATDLRTFLIADLRGYTQFTRERGDEAASEVAGRFAAVVRDVVPGFGGALLEVRGDEALCVFGSARQALRASVALQRVLRAASDGGEVFPLAAGMGLDAGEAVPTDGGYRGDALNLAARLCAIAQPGQVLASDGVLHLARRVEGLRLVERKPVRLKGIEKPVRLVEVVPDEPLPPLPAPPPSPSPRRRRVLVAGLVAAVVAGAAIWFAVVRSQPSASPTVASVVARVGSVAVINPHSGALVADFPVPVGQSPAPIVYGAGALWTYNLDRQTLIRIDPTTGRVRQLGVGVMPTDLTVAYGYVWLANGFFNQLVRVDTAMSNVHTVALPWPRQKLPSTGGHIYSSSGQLAAFDHKIWATARGIDWPQTIVSINPDNLSINRRLYVGSQRQIGDVASGSAGVWMENRTNGANSGKAGLASIAPRITRPTYVGQGGYLQQGIAVSGQYVWFTGGQGNTIFALNTADGSFQPVSTPCTTTALARNQGGVWAACTNRGVIFPVIPTNPQAGRQTHLHRYVNSIAVGPNRIWALIQSSPVSVGDVS